MLEQNKEISGIYMILASLLEPEERELIEEDLRSQE
jgi:hypothetical protein